MNNEHGSMKIPLRLTCVSFLLEIRVLHGWDGMGLEGKQHMFRGMKEEKSETNPGEKNLSQGNDRGRIVVRQVENINGHFFPILKNLSRTSNRTCVMCYEQRLRKPG